MKKEQIFGFLKAPFSGSFIISYLFSFFFLLLTPLLSNIISLLFKNIDALKGLSEDEATTFVLTLLKENVTAPDIFIAGMGAVIGWILISSYSLLLTHKTVISKKGIFDAERISLKFSDILFSVPKLIGYFLLITLATIIPFAIWSAIGIFSIIGGAKLSVMLEILMVFIFFLGLFYLLYKYLCYLLTFNIIFYEEFKLTAFFNYKKIRSTFLAKKRDILISWLLFFVASQIAYTIYASIGLNIFERIMIAGSILEALNLSNIIPIIIGLLIWNFIFVYLTLLLAIVFGKIVLWVEKSPTHTLKKEAKKELRLPSVKTGKRKRTRRK